MNSIQNPYARWFSRVVLVGVAANLCLAIPSLFYPNAVLDALHQRPALESPLWPSFASLLLLLLSAFYVPGALDPERYRASAYLAVLSRFAGVFFFLVRPTDYPLFGYFDLAFGVPSAVLLILYVRSGGGSPSVAAPVAVKGGHVHVAD
jgi:hypothetical protein